MLNKMKLLNEIRSSLGVALDGMAEATEAQRTDAASQEGAMQSRYDTMRIEGSWLADAMHTREQNLKKEARRAETYSLPQTEDRVVEGSLVRVRTGNLATLYFVLPFAAGYESEVAGEELLVVTPRSPLAQELMGKRRGETARFRNQLLEIDEVL